MKIKKIGQGYKLLLGEKKAENEPNKSYKSNVLSKKKNETNKGIWMQPNQDDDYFIYVFVY